jgi:hypothetical protein
MINDQIVGGHGLITVRRSKQAPHDPATFIHRDMQLIASSAHCSPAKLSLSRGREDETSNSAFAAPDCSTRRWRVRRWRVG